MAELRRQPQSSQQGAHTEVAHDHNISSQLGTSCTEYIHTSLKFAGAGDVGRESTRRESIKV